MSVPLICDAQFLQGKNMNHFLNKTTQTCSLRKKSQQHFKVGNTRRHHSLLKPQIPSGGNNRSHKEINAPVRSEVLQQAAVSPDLGSSCLYEADVLSEIFSPVRLFLQLSQLQPLASEWANHSAGSSQGSFANPDLCAAPQKSKKCKEDSPII